MPAKRGMRRCLCTLAQTTLLPTLTQDLKILLSCGPGWRNVAGENLKRVGKITFASCGDPLREDIIEDESIAPGPNFEFWHYLIRSLSTSKLLTSQVQWAGVDEYKIDTTLHSPQKLGMAMSVIHCFNSYVFEAIIDSIQPSKRNQSCLPKAEACTVHGCRYYFKADSSRV